MTTNSDLTAGIRHDLFAGISYGNRSGRRTDVTGIDLDGHFVYRWFVQEAWNHFSASVRTVNPCKFHSSQDLFNDAERWAELGNTFHIAVGRCLALFVREKMLPLECVTLGKGKKLYRVIAG